MALLAEFEKLAQEYNFEVVDASPDIRTVFERLRVGISRVLTGEPREPLFSVAAPPPEVEVPAPSAGEAPAEQAAEPAALPKVSPTAAPVEAGDRPEPVSQALAKAAEGDAKR